VKVYYTGTLINKVIFDGTRRDCRPPSRLNTVIPLD
jgi:hypothetical protein